MHSDCQKSLRNIRSKSLLEFPANTIKLVCFKGTNRKTTKRYYFPIHHLFRQDQVFDLKEYYFERERMLLIYYLWPVPWTEMRDANKASPSSLQVLVVERVEIDTIRDKKER